MLFVDEAKVVQELYWNGALASYRFIWNYGLPGES
jgi:hypothetical protein